MKLNLKNIFWIVFVLILIILFIILIINNKDDIQRLKNIRLSYLLIIILLTLVEFYINGIMLNLLAKPFNVNLTRKEWLNLSIITTMGNYLTFFKGGSSAKAVYLKQKHNLDFSKFLASIGASYIITIMIYGILGLLLITILYELNTLAIVILFLFIAMIITPAILILASPKIKESSNKYFNFIIKIMEGWHLLRKNKGFLFIFSIWTIIFFFVGVVKFYYIFKALSYDVTFLDSTFISLFSATSTLIGLTPSALGIREALIVVSTEIVNIGIKSGIYVSAFDRAITILLIIILGPISTYILLKKSKKA